MEPTPVALEITGDIHLAFGKGMGAGGIQVAEMDRAVGGRRLADLEEGSRTGPHLGVVGRQQQVALGPGQDGCHRRRNPGSLGQLVAGVVQLGQELGPLGGQRTHQRL